MTERLRKNLLIFNVIIIVFAIVLIGLLGVHYLEAKKTCEMRFNNTETIVSGDGIEGIWSYSPKGDYMCVWLDGKTSTEINETIHHEYLHELIFNDYNHFCGE